MKVLKQFWIETFGDYTSDHQYLLELWENLISYYNSPQRYYHNLDHIHQMLLLSDQYDLKITNKKTFNISIFYHDVIYDVSRSDNELKSWELSKHLLSGLIPSNELNLIKTYILATKNHKFNSNSNINLLLDFDLFTLGKSWNEYLEYTKQIRKEYAIYTDQLYIPGRINVLRHFLCSKYIYKTKDFQDKYENQARNNLNKELKYLISLK